MRRCAASARSLEREAEAVALRRQGYSYRRIAEEMGITLGGAWRIVQRALKRVPAGQVDMMRLEEQQVLDALHQAHWQNAINGDIDSTKLVLKISELRAKLFGLHAPVRVDATVRTKTDAELEEMLSELAELPPTPHEL